MSDENVNPNRGRWDHLLREIPTRTTKQPPVVKAPVPPPAPVAEVATETEDEIFSVSEINKAIKKQLEGQFSHLWLKGELSNFKPHTSGHFYFSLKDEKAQINGVMFKGFNSKLKFRPESGMEVLVRGKITVYEPRGNYQIFCEHMEPVGAGALQKAFEQLKAKLQKEGLFEQERKQAIPEHPRNVAVVTSPTGAAIQDILNVLGRRSKRVNVTVVPARVQGDGAAAEIVRGIELANKVDQFDVLIVGRGGGSIEDLWCFNEEIVARAIAASKLPVISSVGHEIDFTISDFVADMRAPTPSAAAELVAKSEQELLERLKFFSKSLRLLMYQKISDLKKRTDHNRKLLRDPRRTLEDAMMRLDDWNQRLSQSMHRNLKSIELRVDSLRKSLRSPASVVENYKLKATNLNKLLFNQVQQKLVDGKSRLEARTNMLDSLSPLRTVDRGYAIVRTEGKLVADATQLQSSQIEIQLRDGTIEADVKKINTKEKV